MAKKKPPRRPLPPDRACGNTLTGGSLVQSLHFDKKKHPRGKPRWNPKASTEWARGHGYRAPEVAETPNQYRVRQFDPGHCVYRTVPFGKSGISGVIETPERRPAKAHVVEAVNEEMLKRALRRKG
jgi:hypothetical protein